MAALKVLPGHQVSFGEQLLGVYGETAINTGYTFSYRENGATKTIPARYSFVYVKTRPRCRSPHFPAPTRSVLIRTDRKLIQN